MYSKFFRLYALYDKKIEMLQLPFDFFKKNFNEYLNQ